MNWSLNLHLFKDAVACVTVRLKLSAHLKSSCSCQVSSSCPFCVTIVKFFAVVCRMSKELCEGGMCRGWVAALCLEPVWIQQQEMKSLCVLACEIHREGEKQPWGCGWGWESPCTNQRVRARDSVQKAYDWSGTGGLAEELKHGWVGGGGLGRGLGSASSWGLWRGSEGSVMEAGLVAPRVFVIYCPPLRVLAPFLLPPGFFFFFLLLLMFW